MLLFFLWIFIFFIWFQHTQNDFNEKYGPNLLDSEREKSLIAIFLQHVPLSSQNKKGF